MTSETRFRAQAPSTNGVDIVGTAALFYDGTEATETRMFGGRIRERVMPGAFDELLAEKPDVLVLWNHRHELVLGRTGAKTAEVFTDKAGLKYRVRGGSSRLHDDVRGAIERGDVAGSSYSFRPDPESEELDMHGEVLVATIHRVEYLEDVGPATLPANPATSADLRTAGGGARLLRRYRELIVERRWQELERKRRQRIR